MPNLFFLFPTAQYLNCNHGFWIWIAAILTVKLPLLRVAGGKELLAFRWGFFTFFITVFEKLTPELSVLPTWCRHLNLLSPFVIVFMLLLQFSLEGETGIRVLCVFHSMPVDLGCKVVVDTFFLAIFSFRKGWLNFLLCHYRSADKTVTDKPQH